MQAPSRSAVADAATAFRADATSLFQLPLQRRTGAVVADLEIVERHPEALRYARPRLFLEVNGTNYLCVLRLKGRQQCSKAATESLQVGFRRISLVWHLGHELDVLPRYLAATVLIDDRIPKYAIEPRDEALLISQRGGGPQGADETVMDDVFRTRFVTHPQTHEVDELLPALQQRLEGFVSHTGSRAHPVSITATCCFGIARTAGAMRGVTETAAARLPL